MVVTVSGKRCHKPGYKILITPWDISAADPRNSFFLSYISMTVQVVPERAAQGSPKFLVAMDLPI